MRADDLVGRGDARAVALFAGGVGHSYAALAEAAAAEAGRLAALGGAAGDRVALYGPKSFGWVAALFGAWRAGGVAVPVNPALKAGQVAHILADSGARLCLSTPERLTQLRAAGALGEAEGVELGAGGGGAGAQVARAADDLAAILYTSGSTGRPKGVMLSHRNLVLAAESVATYQGLGPNDRALAVLPLSFDAGLSVVTSALWAGGAAVLLDYLLPRDVVRAVARHGVTTLPGVPPLLTLLADVDLGAAGTTLRRVTVTGGRMPVALTRRYRALIPGARLYLMYGLTEAFRSLYLDPDEVDTRPESVGKPIPHAEVLIVRADGSPCDADEAGELVHCGPLVAQGYWRDAERTAERFRPAPGHALHGGVAVWSGDTLRRDAHGFHYFVGRRDEMIKTSGLRVSPTEIEEAAVMTGAAVEAAAFGAPDEALGQAIWLVARAGGDADADARLRAGLKAALPSYMQPARIEWREVLPRSPNGKIDRAAIRAELGL